jgi:hypothetical protein
MKRSSTVILRLVIISIALLALLICGVMVPELIRGQVGGYAPILIGMYLSVIPFFIALYQALKLLGAIDKNEAFSIQSVVSLKKIKYSAAIISALYAIGLPYIYIVADRDDAPGVIVIALAIIGGSFTVAVFAGVAQKLFQNAIDIKSENDLTV